jgi:hypothetical protein
MAKRGGVRAPLEHRLWSKVDKNGPGGCWIFTGYTGRRGYGAIWANGKVRGAHQVTWELSGRERPAGLVLDHTCRVRACVNPAHLRLVTQHQNATENNDSPMARNAQRTHCSKGHAFTDDNVAIVETYGPRYDVICTGRYCLTCFPSKWMYALIERKPPPGATCREWRGPLRLPPRQRISANSMR